MPVLMVLNHFQQYSQQYHISYRFYLHTQANLAQVLIFSLLTPNSFIYVLQHLPLSTLHYLCRI